MKRTIARTLRRLATRLDPGTVTNIYISTPVDPAAVARDVERAMRASGSRGWA